MVEKTKQSIKTHELLSAINLSFIKNQRDKVRQRKQMDKEREREREREREIERE